VTGRIPDARRIDGTRRAGGFTLVELMVSLVIGATVVGVGMTHYLQVSTVRGLVRAEANLQTNGYFIDETLKRLVNQAGYRSLHRDAGTSAALPVDTHDEAFRTDGSDWDGGTYLRAFDDGFAFRFEGSSDTAGAADGSLVNCQGTPIETGRIEEVRFTVIGGTLICTSSGASVDLIGIDDDVAVERIDLAWGIDGDDDGSVDGYRDASSPIAAGERPLTLRLSLLLGSREEVLANAPDYTFGGIAYSPPDNRLRRESVTTIRIRN